jgi:hypothetical protein
MKTGYLRVTHPCATLLVSEETFAFDLHVLSTPPAFVLSQDQTLQFNILANHNSIGQIQIKTKNIWPARLLFSFQRSKAVAYQRPLFYLINLDTSRIIFRRRPAQPPPPNLLRRATRQHLTKPKPK